MLTINLGPLILPVSLLMLIVPVLIAYGVGTLLERRHRAAGLDKVLSDILIVALLTARLTFVATWFELYRATPWSMIDIRDGGFTPWVGILAALLMALWRTRRNAALRRPLLLALAIGALVWGAMFCVRQWMQSESTTLPVIPVTTLSGEHTDLAALAGGKPVVINLWASWCPPCRREMPVLVDAQKQYGDISFVFANQGEGRNVVQAYLGDNRLNLSNVLLDRNAALGKAVGSMVLPTTLFYGSNGQLLYSHMGELSAASLADKLKQLQESTKISNRSKSS